MDYLTLKTKIDSFKKLEQNWNGYNSDKITKESILTAQFILKNILINEDLSKVDVFPIANFGIQFDIGLDREIEISNNKSTFISYNENMEIIKEEEIVYDIIDILSNLIVGLSEDEAISILKEFDIRYRLTKINKESLIITCDFRLDRLNLEIENKIVTKTYIG